MGNRAVQSPYELYIRPLGPLSSRFAMSTSRALVSTLVLSLALPAARAQRPPDRPPIDIGAEQPAEQPERGGRWSGGLFGHYGLPVGAFHRNEDGGFGGGLHGAFALDRAHMVAMRMEGGLLMYGYVSRNRRVPSYDEYTGEFLGYDDVSYAVRQHQMYTFDVGPEITALRGMWRPYGFATAGISYFVSTMNVRPPNYSGDSGDNRTLFSAGNFAWSSGVGMRVGSNKPRGGLFDFGVRFRRNDRARYANDRAISTNSTGAIVVTPFYGSANVFTIYAGFWIGPGLTR